MLSNRISFALKLFVMVLTMLALALQVVIARPADAITEEQKRMYRLGINYYEVAECGEIAADAEADSSNAAESNSLQQLARSMLANDNIKYWTNDEGINTRDVVVALSKGEKAYTTAANAPNKTADLNPNILKFILAAAEKGKIHVNALTDKTHTSSSSNHYTGNAVDLDIAPQNTSVPVGTLNSIADKYGGAKNNEGGHHHYDFLQRPSDSEGGPADDDADAGSIYMLGDSITLRSKDQLKAEFDAMELKSYINASEGRSITGKGTTTGQKTSGLEAVEDDKSRIANAGTIIIALGTNQNPDFQKSIGDLITKIRSYNKDAKIYWVNVFLNAGGVKGDINDKIKKASVSEDFAVIDTVQKNIPLDPDKIHPTIPEGTGLFAKTVATGIESEKVVDSAVQNPCVCGGEEFDGNEALRGSENAEKIWNFFIDKGLKPYQVAGMLGNIEVESGFNPRALQPSTTGNAPVPNMGYGLVQWTDSGRQSNLIRRAQEQKVKVYNLEFQIKHIWWELNNTEKAAYDDLRGTRNVQEAWSSFSHKYERPAAPDNPERGKAAQRALAKFGSGSSRPSSSSSDTTSCAPTGGDTGVSEGGEYSLPLAKKWYTENKSDFTKPHHDYAAADIPVPVGTPVYSMTAGKVVLAPVGGGCGQGVLIRTSEGVEYTYCHGTNGGSVRGARQGDTVKAGQRIMTSGNTGSSSGPHLHVQIKVNGQLRCPQTLFVSIADGSPKKESSLPSSGCSY